MASFSTTSSSAPNDDTMGVGTRNLRQGVRKLRLADGEDNVVEEADRVLQRSIQLEFYRERVKHPAFLSAAVWKVVQDQRIDGLTAMEVAQAFGLTGAAHLNSPFFMRQLNPLVYATWAPAEQVVEKNAAMLHACLDGVSSGSIKALCQQIFRTCQDAGLLARNGATVTAAVLMLTAGRLLSKPERVENVAQQCAASPAAVSSTFTLVNTYCHHVNDEALKRLVEQCSLELAEKSLETAVSALEELGGSQDEDA